MFWALVKACCCLYNNRSLLRNNRSYDTDKEYVDDGEEEEEEEEDLSCDQRSLSEASSRKLNAVHAAVDSIHVERLLDRHPDDSSLLTYHDKCSQRLQIAMTRLHMPERRTESRGSKIYTVV